MKQYQAWILAIVHVAQSLDYDYENYPTQSGVGAWVDVDTPENARTKASTRGETWELVMSDEFEIDGRTFEPGKDHLWTALDLPDGVNAAIEYYNMTNVYTKGGKLMNRIDEGPVNVTYFNQWLEKPAYETGQMHYSAGMMQSWNKFCFQGGLIEVSVKLPGAINTVPDDVHKSVTTNPNALGVMSSNGQQIKLTPRDKIKDVSYYPTWPGVWLMGNLGRALFTASTTRMWPWTYNECDADLSPNQAISACNANPGFGLNPNQGRGAPEIDVLEGGGNAISSSIQIAPGMPSEYRVMPTQAPDPSYCIYGKYCVTPGANMADAPTKVYAYRGYKSWYQGLRYASNDRCPSVPEDVQTYEPVAAVRANPALLTSNVFDKTQMSAGRDVNADLGLIDGKGTKHWGINYNGTCFPITNSYYGAFLCDPDAKGPRCASPRKEGVAPTKQMDSFEYQMDAVSVNWDLSHEAYVTFYIYQVEWVMGPNGYVRWNLADQPLFEIPASALTSPPQAPAGSGKPRNPKKIMIEEPMYLIFNIALARAWGARPPNADQGPCRGSATYPVPGSDQYKKDNNICDSFPMYMETEYIRLYQDKSTMFIGCDPPTHPTKQWIDGHIKWYTDTKNPMIRVDGGATCNSDNDCVARGAGYPSGRCVDRRCKCVTGYGGPRCTKYLGTKDLDTSSPNYFGPPPVYSVVVTALVVLAVAATSFRRSRQIAVQVERYKSKPAPVEDEQTEAQPHAAAQRRFYAPPNLPT
ncbi:unnamed protein product [Aphanomyces euteiches]|uniref:EGF-like domain-containing protein n=1 Tax=Aphanomyces euteiches TaxID=100861 RepID=A0A6G0WLG4_9STRA|nr:hypothetical protein Ae201684_013979 [Aphanomyces euteiches]KAH9083074.1 hypothetical protein Ae201684P_013975 [Aphanomyces euteiches]KAH9152022.1 hypothetical protein AeRB84_005491 [Aphanomyces euteiches]